MLETSMLFAMIGALASLVGVVAFVIDRIVPALGNLPVLRTRRETRRMMATGHHIDYAGRWRYGIGERSTVTREATPAELKYLGVVPAPLDGHREMTGGL